MRLRGWSRSGLTIRTMMVSVTVVLLSAVFALRPVAAAAPMSPTVIHVGQIDRQDIPPQPGSEPDTLVEPDVAISKVNPAIAVAVAHDGRFPGGGAVDISYAWTHDGGAHWRHAPMAGLTRATGGAWDRASDPVVAFGPNGDVFISVLVFDTGCRSGVTVSRSIDGGATFGAPVIVHASPTCNYSDDKNWLVIDTQPLSLHRGRIYQFWTAFINGNPFSIPQVLRWSDDNGANWSGTHYVSGPHANTQNSQPMIQPDGSIIDAYIKGSSIVSRSSHDGGATWGPEALVARSIGGGPPGIRCCLPAGSADPVTGELHVVWEANGAGNQDPVMISSSPDGRHWSAAHTVSSDGGRTTIRHVNSTVTAYGGRVFVSYGTLDTAIAGGRFLQQQVSASYDRGKTFGSPLSLGPRSDLRYAAFSRGKFPGDYIGASATRGRVVVVWCVSSAPADPAATFHQTLFGAVLRP